MTETTHLSERTPDQLYTKQNYLDVDVQRKLRVRCVCMTFICHSQRFSLTTDGEQVHYLLHREVKTTKTTFCFFRWLC